MVNVRLAGDHLYGKQLFTWLSLVVSLMAFFVLYFFPLDVLDEIWDLIESVSEGFLTYSLRKARSTKPHTGVEVNHIWLMAFYEFQNDKKKSLLTPFFGAPKSSKISIFTVSFDCLYKRGIIITILNE